MRKSAYMNSKRKNTDTTKIKINQRPKDDDLSKYNGLNQEISKIIRTINMQFDFKNFKKENLKSLEIVSISFY